MDRKGCGMMPILVLLCGLVPHDVVEPEHFDSVERNAVYDGEGKPVFVQYLFRNIDWTGLDRIEAWRICKKEMVAQKIGNRWQVIFWDTSGGEVLRVVWCYSVPRSWTQHDIETAQRVVVPVHFRQELQPRKVTEFRR